MDIFSRTTGWIKINWWLYCCRRGKHKWWEYTSKSSSNTISYNRYCARCGKAENVFSPELTKRINETLEAGKRLKKLVNDK